MKLHAQLVVGLAVLLFLPVHSLADSHWFSGPVVHPAAAQTKAAGLRVIEAFQVASPGTRLFDVMVSLHSDPPGDDDGSTQGVDPNSAQQDTIERILQFFADGVYESTEGMHKIRRIRIFRNKRNHAVADIRWDPSGHPCANLNGIADSGRHIYNYDVFEGGAGHGADYNLLNDPIGAGYTLAHEWGHYAYGLKDEYVKQTGDLAVMPAMMSSQWMARDAGSQTLVDARWLNFSIAHQGDPPGPFQNTRRTDHHRKYGESCWETLVRGNTLLESIGSFFSADPPRVVYPELTTVAPSGTTTPSSPDLPGTAGSDLEIIWMTDDLVYEIVIDRSGSMVGPKISNALTAAKLLVDLAEPGSTVGVIAFESTPTTVVPLTTVTDQGSRDSIKAAIDSIVAGGGTGVGAAAQAALSALLGTAAPEGTKVTFLLSDGLSGDNALAPIPGYQAAQIPIFAFSYGADADTLTLGQMASQTNGQLYISPTSLAAVSQAFQDANAAASSATNVAFGSNTAGVDGESFSPLLVDTTLQTLNLTATFTGAPTDATLELVAPDGTRIAPAEVNESAGETLLLFSVEQPQPGLWQIAARGNVGAVTFTFQASGTPDGVTVSLTSDVFNGERTLTYPEPFVIRAGLVKDLPIVNAVVEATITAPDATTTVVPMNDAGIAPDAAAGDGSYAAAVDYNQTGVYEVLVRASGQAGVAMQTAQGLEATAVVDGFEAIPFDPPEPLQEDFQRFDRFQVGAQGVVGDDHGNAPVMATLLPAENVELIAGRIETGGDLDVFEVLVPAEASEVAIRVSNLLSAMDPRVRIFDAAGTLLAEETLATASSQGGFLSVIVPTAGGETLFLEVSHVDPGGTGGYQVSAGTVLRVDGPATRAPRQVKLEVLAELLALEAAAIGTEAQRLEHATRHLARSLEEDLWRDDSHLTKKGKKVFDEARKAAKDLEKLIKEIGDDSAIADAILAALVDLVSADRELATIVMEEALDAGSDSPELQKAAESFEDGREKEDGGDYEKAIREFKKVWEHAMKALRMPLDPVEETVDETLDALLDN